MYGIYSVLYSPIKYGERTKAPRIKAPDDDHQMDRSAKRFIIHLFIFY